MAKGLFYHFAEPSKNRNLQVKYEIDKILNSDLPITSEVLFNKFYRFGICSKASKLKLLLKKAFTQNIDINSQDKNGYTFLHYSIKKNFCDITLFLLKKGADPNIQFKDGNTSLHKIANKIYSEKTKIALAKLFIQKGCNIELKNTLGWTAVQLAIMNDSNKLVKLLIQYGADIRLIPEPVVWYNCKLRALLALIKVCKYNDFSMIDYSITHEDIQEFLEWQISITPENSRFFSKHLKELNNLQCYLTTNTKLTDIKSMKQLKETINFYNTLKNSLIFRIVENPDLYDKDTVPDTLLIELNNKSKDFVLKLTGEANEVIFETP